MRIVQCLIGGTSQTVMGTAYSFEKDNQGRFVCRIENDEHAANFTAVTGVYKDITAEVGAAAAVLPVLAWDLAGGAEDIHAEIMISKNDKGETQIEHILLTQISRETMPVTVANPTVTVKPQSFFQPANRVKAPDAGTKPETAKADTKPAKNKGGRPPKAKKDEKPADPKDDADKADDTAENSGSSEGQDDTQAPTPDETTGLIGSNVYPADVPIEEGVNIAITDIVVYAREAAQMKPEEWNALPQAEREAMISDQVTELRGTAQGTGGEE